MHRSQHTQLDYYAKFKSTHGAGNGDGGAAVVIASCFSSFFVLFCNQTKPTGLSNNTHRFITISFSSQRIPTLELMRILLLLLLLSVCFKFPICSHII